MVLGGLSDPTSSAAVLPASPTASVDAPDAASAAVIAEYQASIPQQMAEQGVPGLAVVVVDGDHVVWAEGFGRLERDGSAPVTTDTLFSVQSMSKPFTAAAVMIAVQDGLVDLDEPITTYLPEFTVNSVFEEHPERKITLRMLLGHTAGFTHEAPIGNNFELDAADFDAHVRSISDTWLRFPVGTGYAYSNLGIDLAGFILERVHGRPFAEVMETTLLEPLGMERSTFDPDRIRTASDRAIGHVAPMPEVPVDVPMAAAGGLYASADDLARFLSFQLGDGAIDGDAVLDSRLMAEMRTVPEPRQGASAGYALGVVRHRWFAGRNADLFDHGGGGFGFLSDLWWLPDVQLGIAILTNSSDHALQNELALSILFDLTHRSGSAYRDRLTAMPVQAPATEPDGRYQASADARALLAEAALPRAGDEVARWASYAGAYREVFWGVVDPLVPAGRFLVDDGEPYLETGETGTIVRHALTEIEPALFIADDGEVLDLRSTPPTWRNVELARGPDGPATWQWIVLGVAGLIALAWLVMAGLRAGRRLPRNEGPRAHDAHGRGRLGSIVAAFVAIVALATIGLIAAMPALVDAGFIGWLEFDLPLRLALHLPLLLTVAGGLLLAVTAVGWAQGWWSGRERFGYASLVAVVAVLVGQLAAWRLIGWGLT